MVGILNRCRRKRRQKHGRRGHTFSSVPFRTAQRRGNGIGWTAKSGPRERRIPATLGRDIRRHRAGQVPRGSGSLATWPVSRAWHGKEAHGAVPRGTVEEVNPIGTAWPRSTKTSTVSRSDDSPVSHRRRPDSEQHCYRPNLRTEFELLAIFPFTLGRLCRPRPAIDAIPERMRIMWDMRELVPLQALTFWRAGSRKRPERSPRGAYATPLADVFCHA